MEQNLSLYYAFHTVAKKGSISHAAKELYISQPAISKSIQKLEDNLNTTLFKRSSRGVTLTADGEILFQHTSAAFDALMEGEEILARHHALGVDQLRIGVSTTLCKYILLPHLQRFIKAYPHVKISISCQSTYQTLTLLEGQAAAVQADLDTLAEQRRAAQKAERSAAEAKEALAAHPLYPADEAALRQRADAIVPQKAPSPLLTVFTVGLIIISGVLAFLFRADALPFWIFTAMAVLGIVTTAFAVKFRRQAIVERQKFAEKQRAALESQMAEYLPLRVQEARLQAEARRLADIADGAEESCRRRLAALTAQVRRFEPGVQDLGGAQVALAAARRRQAELAAARQQAREAALYRDALQKPEQSAAGASLTVPTMSKEDTAAALSDTLAQLAAERSRFDTLTGRIRSLDRSSDLQDQLAQKQEQLSALREEYDAIALAMEALEQANTTLQNRFSPALGARAAEIFSAITAGRYDRVLLSRDFSLSAEPAGDPVGRSIRLLSQGAADQLYLAVRLAICDMVLPEEKRVPLILDDALVSFDDDRLHAALDYLLAESEKRQILLFSCQKREMDYLSGRKNVTVGCL